MKYKSYVNRKLTQIKKTIEKIKKQRTCTDGDSLAMLTGLAQLALARGKGVHDCWPRAPYTCAIGPRRYRGATSPPSLHVVCSNARTCRALKCSHIATIFLSFLGFFRVLIFLIFLFWTFSSTDCWFFLVVFSVHCCALGWNTGVLHAGAQVCFTSSWEHKLVQLGSTICASPPAGGRVSSLGAQVSTCREHKLVLVGSISFFFERWLGA